MDLENLEVIQVDYNNPKHARDLVFMMDVYASDIMGGGKLLTLEVKKNLVTELTKIKQAFSVLVYREQEPLALANCFYGFSTFKCKPLVNIHDFVVLDSHRGRGLGQLLLQHIEDIAKQSDCCKITLEVLEGNTSAQKAYAKFGFGAYQLDPAAGKALFWEKGL